MKNNILILRRRWRQTPGAMLICECKTPHLLKEIEFTILVYWYDVVTPFGREGKEEPPLLPLDPWFDQLGWTNQRSLWVFEAFPPLELGLSGGCWHWRQRMPGSFLSHECETPHLLTEISDFDGDSEREKDYCKVWFAEEFVTDVWEINQRKTYSDEKYWF